MNVENLEVIRENYEDLRFGLIDIYYDEENDLMVMKKDDKAENDDKFQNFIK